MDAEEYAQMLEKTAPADLEARFMDNSKKHRKGKRGKSKGKGKPSAGKGGYGGYGSSGSYPPVRGAKSGSKAQGKGYDKWYDDRSYGQGKYGSKGKAKGGGSNSWSY